MTSVFTLPVTRVEVELTEACNLRCQFCYNSCAPRESRDAESILRLLAEAGVMEIILTGGEPALHSRFPAVLALACTLFPRVMVQSNGTLFAESDAFAVLHDNPIFCLNFSLHGPEAIHNELVGYTGAFDATCSALRHAVGAGIRVASNLVLNRKNTDADTLRETATILAALGCREMTLTRFIPTGQGKGQPLGLSQREFVAALTVLEEAASASGLTLLLANAVPACQMPENLRHLCNRCSFGHDKFYVDVDGRVLVCGMSRQALGNILETGTLRGVLDASPLYARYRTLEHLPEKCLACPDLEMCGGGCRAAALARTNQVQGEDSLLD